MDPNPLHRLSEPARNAASAALAAAFGSRRITHIAAIAGGASGAFPFRVEADGRSYLLRIEGAPSPLRNPHQYRSMRIAAEADIAPRVHYIDEAARVAITDFVVAQPLSSYPGGMPELGRTLGQMLRRLQATPSFPAFVDYPDIVGRLFAHVRRTGLFAAGVLDRHVDRFERLSQSYAAGASAAVSSHNDCIPANILFDGRRLWLIDWESAYRNDPLVDVAIMLDTLARTPELEDELLLAWLGRRPDEALLDRLSVVRALTRLYYAGVFLSASAAADWMCDGRDLSAPSLKEFERVLAEGWLKPGAPETKHVLGKMFLASFLAPGLLPPRFEAAV